MNATFSNKMRRPVNIRAKVPSGAEVMVEQTDHELVALCKEGDRRAFGVLVQRYQRRAFAVAMGYLKNPEDAMDAAQDAFVKVFRNIKGFKGDSSFYTWLYRIVVNVCIDHIRKHRKRRHVEYDETFQRRDEANVGPLAGNTRPMHPGVAAEGKQLNAALHAALDELSENHRTIVVLREVEGRSYEEIAEIMDCHLGTVMSRLHHARKNLQKALKPYLEATGNPMGERAGAGVRGTRKKRSEA
jgi:RNA polymerase sigma-70 factor, ECF subfamily